MGHRAPRLHHHEVAGVGAVLRGAGDHRAGAARQRSLGSRREGAAAASCRSKAPSRAIAGSDRVVRRRAHSSHQAVRVESAFFLLSLAFFLTRDLPGVACRGASSAGAGQLPRARLRISSRRRSRACSCRSRRCRFVRCRPRPSARSSIACCRTWLAWKGSSRASSTVLASNAVGVTLRNEAIDLAAAVNRVVGQLSDRASNDKGGFLR